MLAMHPDVQLKLFEEISEFSSINFHDLPPLKYLDYVINEVMRLFPIFPLIPRETTEEIILDDLNIGKGVTFLISLLNLDRWS